jgi:FMN phosphatase YigB (HAD superfamily)
VRRAAAIIFDLDDTLYPEAEFCRQAFERAAEVLEQRGVGPRIELARRTRKSTALSPEGRSQ